MKTDVQVIFFFLINGINGGKKGKYWLSAANC